jgi:HEXXH motif-containing protein
VLVRNGSHLMSFVRRALRQLDPVDVNESQWIPITNVRTTHGEHGITLELNPFEDLVDRRELDARALSLDNNTWARLITDAWRILVNVQPHHAASMSRLITTLVTDYPTGDTHPSGTSPLAFGAIRLTCLPDAYYFADTLIHEFHHTKLNGLMDEAELIDRTDTQLYYAPWRPDPRPLRGFIHGIYAFSALASYWAAVIDQVRDQEVQRRAMLNVAYTRCQVAMALSQLDSTKSLTSAGKAFVAGIGDTLRVVDQVAVDPGSRRHAQQRVDVNAQEWKQNHRRPITNRRASSV